MLCFTLRIPPHLKDLNVSDLDDRLHFFAMFKKIILCSFAILSQNFVNANADIEQRLDRLEGVVNNLTNKKEQRLDRLESVVNSLANQKNSIQIGSVTLNKVAGHPYGVSYRKPSWTL